MNGNIALQKFREYLGNRNFSNFTVNKYFRNVRVFLLYCQKKDVKEITGEDILHYEEYIHDCGKYVISSQVGMLRAISHFFRLLSKQEIILLNPFDKLDIKKVTIENKRNSIAEDKLSIILDSIDGTKYVDLRDRALFELMYGSGIRVGEAIRLTMTDVDFQGYKIFIRDGKGRKDRIVPLGQNVLRILKQYIEYGRDYLTKIVDRENLFLSKYGKKLDVNAIEKALKNRANKMYPDLKISPHILRHSFATHMLEAGANIKQIKDILGHSSIETTVIYTHFNTKSMKKILKMYHPRENELYEEINPEDIKNDLTK